MKPLEHARITARRYGGRWTDWIHIHNWYDSSKAHFAGVQHRIFLHSDFGLWLADSIFGSTLSAADGTQVPTRAISIDHQTEDLGRIVTLREWLGCVRSELSDKQRSPKPHLAAIRENPVTELARKWGGEAEHYRRLVEFFDKPCELAPEHGALAALITHNSFGIFLAEQLFGVAFKLGEVRNSTSEKTKKEDRARLVPYLVSTRSIAEDLVEARMGWIPTASQVAAHTRLKLWMRGSEVRAALRLRARVQETREMRET